MIERLQKQINALGRRLSKLETLDSRGVWTDYSSTSTITGWSSYTTKEIWYKKVGNIVFCTFRIEGTSDATSVSFTLPDTSYNTGTGMFTNLIRVKDNGSWQADPGLCGIADNSTTVNCYKTTAGGNTFTASGTKHVSGEFWYEAS